MRLFPKVSFKKYTFIFVPDVTSKFIRFTIPKFVVKGGILATVALIAAVSWFSYTILEKSHEVKDLERLHAAYAEQQIEIQRVNKKAKHIEAQLARINVYDQKLRVITALESKSAQDFEKVGGPNHEAVDFSAASDKYTVSLLKSLDANLDRIGRKAEAQELSYFELDEFFKEQSALLSHTPSIWAVKGGWITSTFGYRQSPFTGLREMHEGLDIATHVKAPVLATANGIVIRANSHRGYGKFVEIDHGYGVVTRYGHNSKNLVKVGQKVKRGEVIALVGNTGRSTGPHLHYEVHLNGVPVNPVRYILED